MLTQNHNYARAFTADYVRICVMSIFLSVYTQTHPHLPLPLAICFHTDDFHMCWKAQQNIFSGRKVSKKTLFSGQLDIVEFHEEDGGGTKEKERKIREFFLLLRYKKDLFRHFPFFFHLERMKEKMWKKDSLNLQFLKDLWMNYLWL